MSRSRGKGIPIPDIQPGLDADVLNLDGNVDAPSALYAQLDPSVLVRHKSHPPRDAKLVRGAHLQCRERPRHGAIIAVEVGLQYVYLETSRWNLQCEIEIEIDRERERERESK
jgi:hypothetical protein